MATKRFKMKRPGDRFAIVPIHGERATLFTVVDQWAPPAQQPHVVAQETARWRAQLRKKIAECQAEIRSAVEDTSLCGEERIQLIRDLRGDISSYRERLEFDDEPMFDEAGGML